MLAIFDIDGTVCDTQEVEGRCYVEAIRQVTGVRLESLDWTLYEEPTSSAIVRGILGDKSDASKKEAEIKELFVCLMQKERPHFPGDFSPLSGAVEFIQRLKEEKICSVAFATGCFDSEAAFKLACCGIEGTSGNISFGEKL